ncbi:MAG: hypothetical protein KBT46_03000 [Ruminococcus sp.]|nr:hypothetical protein [Candidatus Copronaster equi]
MVKNRSKGMKFISVILGAIVCGFMWRCRGEGGFGSSWGLYSVGLVMMLLIYHFYSDRKGMKYEMIPFGALMLGLSVTGYATVIEQLAGVVWSDLPYSGKMINGLSPVLTMPEGDVYAPINPVSGAVIIFLMSITLIPLFSFFVTSLFSDKEYKIRHYVIAIAVFYISSLIFKASISHLIIKAINPDQVQYAFMGLKESGYDFSSPMQAYMSHFLDRRWTQEIPFFENYYMSIEHISDALAVLVLSGYALIFRKDKYTGFGSIILDVLTGAASTVLTPLISCRFNSGFFEGVTIPNWFLKIASWGVWEYATGFFIGFFIMLFLALTADKHSICCGDDDTPLFADRKLSFGFNFVLTVFIFGVTPARAISIRFARLLEKKEILPDDEPLATIIIVILSIIFGIFMIKLFSKNILKDGSNAYDMLPYDFAKKALPAYLVMCFIVYFFLDDLDILYIKEDVTVPLMLISSALIAVIYSAVRMAMKKREKV